MLEQGATPEEILRDYPDLEPDDIRACLAYARALVANEEDAEGCDDFVQHG